MKFSCTQENITKALRAVSNITGKNITLPILNYTLVQGVEGNGIIFTTTNLEIGIRYTLRGKVEKEGSYLLPAKLLSEVVHLLPIEKLTITVDQQECVIQGEGVETKVKGLPSDDFPLLPTIENPTIIHCSTHELRNALLNVIFASSTEEIRPELSGVLFWLHGKELTLAATDSYRLGERKVVLKEPVQEERRAIVPRRSLEELLRNLGEEGDGEIEIRLSDNQILFVFHEMEILSRLISGNYPDYQQIIPRRSTTAITLPTKTFELMVKSTSLFCKSGINDVHLAIKAKEQILAISAASSQLGEQRMTQSVHVSGEDNDIIFNYRYLLDGLKSIATSDVVLEVVNNTSPGVLHPKETEVPFLYLIMPIKQ